MDQTQNRSVVFSDCTNLKLLKTKCFFLRWPFQVKNETHALWSWNRNQDLYYLAADVIHIVRQPEMCSVCN